MHRILAITRVGCIDQWKRGVGMAYLAIWFCTQILGDLLQRLGAPSIDPVAQQARAQQALSHGSTVAIFLAAVVAARSVPQEIEQRTLCAVMVRPVARWEYLLGRVAGCAVMFKAGMLLLLFTALVQTAIAGGMLSGEAWFAWLSAVCSGISWIVILVVVAAVTSYWVTIIATVSLMFLGTIIEKLPSAMNEMLPALPVLKTLLHYASRPDIPSAASATGWLAMADSLGYGAIFFLVGAWVFGRGDLRLRGS